MSRPSKRTRPSSGSISRTTVRARVDLPQPDSPTTPERLAALRARAARRSAHGRRGPGGRPGGRAPCGATGKRTTTSSIDSSGTRRSCGLRHGGLRAGRRHGLVVPAGDACGSGADRRRAAGTSRRQRLGREAAARVEGAARRASRRGRRRALDRQQRPPLARRRAAPSRAGRAYRRGADGAKTRRDGAGLDDAARIHDGDAVAGLRHDAEVVGDEDHAHAEPVAQAEDQLQDLVLDGDVERGGGLVGEEQLRVRRRARWRSWRAGACRRRTGAGSRRAGVAAPGCRRGRAVRSRGRGGRARRARCGRAALSSICRPTVSTGFSAVIGSWKIIAISRPRTRAQAPAPAAPSEVASRPSQHAARDAAGRVHEAQDASAA